MKRKKYPRRIPFTSASASQIDDELAFHIEMRVRERIAEGKTEAEARAAVLHRFGDVNGTRGECIRIAHRRSRRMARAQYIDDTVQDLRQAARGLLRTPSLAISVTCAFALGIGANVATYGVADRLLFSAPAHIREPAEVRSIVVHQTVRGEPRPQDVHAYPDLTALRASTQAHLAGYDASVREMTAGRGESAVRVRAHAVTGAFFDVLGAPATLGRVITAEDDREGAVPVVVISHGLWTSRYGARSDVIGKSLAMGDVGRTIIGVMPAGFTGAGGHAVDAWIPLAPDRFARQGPGWDRFPGNYWLRIVARRSPAATNAALDAELSALLRSARATDMAEGRYLEDARIVTASLIAAESPLAPPEIRVGAWLMGVSILVLLVACTNIANLLVVRRIRGQRENTVRAALGATSARLARSALFESLILALVGGAAALAVGRIAGGVLGRTLLPAYDWSSAGSSARLFWLSLGATVAAALLAAALPMVQAVRGGSYAQLRSGASQIAAGASRTRTVLMLVQVAFSVILLVGAGVFVRSFHGAGQTDLGIEPRDAWVISLDTDDMSARDSDALHGRVAEAIAQVPGVRAAGASSTWPLFNRHGVPGLRVDGRDSLPSRPLVHAVTHGYFDAVGLALRSGRLLQPDDRSGAPLAAVVNQRMADELWSGQAIGRCMYMAPDAACTRVVGIVEDAHVGGLDGTEPDAALYVAAAQQTPADGLGNVIVRTASSQGDVITAVRRAALHADARIRYADADPVSASLDSQVRSWRVGATLFSMFGALAAVIATLGLYTAIAFEIAQRTKELGVRSALGASPRRIAGGVLARTTATVTAGLVVGLGGALAIAPRVQPLLYQTSARDALTCAAVAVLLLLCGVMASALPGWRAARVDPMIALRPE